MLSDCVIPCDEESEFQPQVKDQVKRIFALADCRRNGKIFWTEWWQALLELIVRLVSCECNCSSKNLNFVKFSKILMFSSVFSLMFMATKSEYRSYLTFVMPAFRTVSFLASSGRPVLYFVFHTFAGNTNKKSRPKIDAFHSITVLYYFMVHPSIQWRLLKQI